MPETILSRASLSSFSSVTSLTSTQTQLDNLVSHFVEEAANPQTLAAITAGGMAYRLGRIGALVVGEGHVAAMPLRFFSYAAGLGSEVTAFEFTTRSLQTFYRSPITDHQSPNLWSWSGPGGWRDGLATSLVTFGTLRVAGSLARQQNIVLQHLFQSSAMVMGHQIAGGIGVAPRPEGTLAGQFLHAEATNLQLSAGSSLLHAMAPGLHALERGLHLTLHSTEIDLITRRGPNRLTPQWATAAPENGEIQRPGEKEPIERANLVLMAKGRGEGRQPSQSNPSLATLIGQVSSYGDVRSAKIALRVLYVGVTGPLREEILNTIEKIEGGQPHNLVIGNLLSDPRLPKTRFLSNELQRRVADQIRDLKGGARSRDTGTFFFNLSQGLVDAPSTPKEAAAPVRLSAEALLPLQELRLHQLEELLSQDDPLPFLTTREALAEGIDVAKSFARIIQGLKKNKDRDLLTQLRSRSNLEEIAPRLERIFKQNPNPDEPDVILMLDIDFFKKINTQYGHPGGDEVLREVAQILRDPKTIQVRDIMGRYGGEEFLIDLIRPVRGGAQIAAERIRTTIEEHLFEIGDKDSIHITVSIGAAELRDLPTEKEERPLAFENAPILSDGVARADDALYAAKNTGRNRVIHWGDSSIDWVTLMHNRAGLDRITSELEADLVATPKPFQGRKVQNWVLMIDIDDLELIDFAYGSRSRDKVLRKTAKSLLEIAAGISHTAASYEGKFFIHLKASNQEEALEFAEKIREGIAKQEIPIEGRPPIHLTASIGAARMRPLPPKEEGGVPMIEGSLQYAIERATRASEEARKSGRNQIVISSE